MPSILFPPFGNVDPTNENSKNVDNMDPTNDKSKYVDILRSGMNYNTIAHLCERRRRSLIARKYFE